MERLDPGQGVEEELLRAAASLVAKAGRLVSLVETIRDHLEDLRRADEGIQEEIRWLCRRVTKEQRQSNTHGANARRRT